MIKAQVTPLSHPLPILGPFPNKEWNGVDAAAGAGWAHPDGQGYRLDRTHLDPWSHIPVDPGPAQLCREYRISGDGLVWDRSHSVVPVEPVVLQDPFPPSWGPRGEWRLSQFLLGVAAPVLLLWGMRRGGEVTGEVLGAGVALATEVLAALGPIVAPILDSLPGAL